FPRRLLASIGWRIALTSLEALGKVELERSQGTMRVLTKAVGIVAVAAAAVGIIANLKDIKRYLRISTM
ncbi:MAG TPA: hypothetical protein VMB03_30200, partial [Bryobacteraceae bacterium]|nr:hypothetical protein [Bryobacteraceae bacterium]